MNTAYVEGFIKACEARGIDPEQLVKLALLPTQLVKGDISDVAKIKANEEQAGQGAKPPVQGLANAAKKQ